MGSERKVTSQRFEDFCPLFIIMQRGKLRISGTTTEEDAKGPISEDFVKWCSVRNWEWGLFFIPFWSECSTWICLLRVDTSQPSTPAWAGLRGWRCRRTSGCRMLGCSARALPWTLSQTQPGSALPGQHPQVSFFQHQDSGSCKIECCPVGTSPQCHRRDWR